jgi:hypothetical protein
MSYDPQSTDAMFSRLEEMLKQQNIVIARIDLGVAKTNGRVNKLESYNQYWKGVTAVIAFSVSAVATAAISYFFKK